MSLQLPGDLEPYVSNYNQLHSPGAYALVLEKPSDLAGAWEAEYDTQPDYWPELRDASECFYVGGTGDLLSRLEDHRNGDRDDDTGARSTVLTELCSIEGLQTAWVAESPERATDIIEPRLARWLQKARPSAFVHQR